MGACQIFGPDRRCQSIGAVVGERDHLLFLVEGRDVAAWSENLVANDWRCLRQSRPDRRLDERARGIWRIESWYAAPEHDARPLGLRFIVEGQHLLAMLLADQGTHRSRLVEGIAELQLGRGRFQTLDEGIEDRPLDIDAFGAETDLAAIGKD